MAYDACRRPTQMNCCYKSTMKSSSSSKTAVIILASLLLLEVALAKQFAFTSRTTSNSPWNPPIRIGIEEEGEEPPASSCSSQSTRGGRLQPRKFPNLLASATSARGGTTTTTTATTCESSFVVSSANNNNNNNVADDSSSSSIYDEEEWKALFQDDERTNKSPVLFASHRTAFQSSNSRRTSSSIDPYMSRSECEEVTGFHKTIHLPALFTREKDEEIPYNEYEEAQVVPCAAVAVSGRFSSKPASFSSPTRGESRLNQRKDASFFKQQQQQQQPSTSSSKSSSSSSTAAAAAAASATGSKGRPLVFWENMLCGAVSRSIAQTIMHPANTMKTILQQSNAPPMTSFLAADKLPVLFRGAGANFILSVPHGAINFAVLELVRKELTRGVRRTKFLADREEKIGPALDFLSSALSTICCSVVSTPQMMITDNIMAGNYKNLPEAVRGLAAQGKGLQGFYARGWWPGLVGKIPSYALTWTFFQQLKQAQHRFSGREATNIENSIMGCLASGTCVCIMIPMDTIKTRLVTQASSAAFKSGAVQYKGIIDCAVRVASEEGISAFYRGLPPRLVSVVPMIGIQFTVYEFMKRVMQKRALERKQAADALQRQIPPLKPPFMREKKEKEEEFDPYSSLEILQEASMEVAASPEHPYPAPHFLRIMRKKTKDESNNER